MRIRLPFAGLFFLLLLLAGYAGLSSLQVDVFVNDKILHLVTFFALTLVFYWIIDTNRRRTLNLTLIVCTLGLGVGSEFVQALLPNGREFDLFDLVANVVGSLASLGLCSWYHQRMLERKRTRRQYNAVPGEDTDDAVGDLELGEGIGLGGGGEEHEEGVVAANNNNAITTTTAERSAPTLEEEVDNWDENAVDAWDEDDIGDIGVSSTAPLPKAGKDIEAKRTD
ncbi:hypothetical protein B0H66DRAFT_552113 [Apodospora peruviana]|uniref:VanZ-like domain-containing protein n=1 Tax=Apodospora peruviana TaxID=516989 RepID=A0AAE0IBD2_9PEZI|nr:hypothetical protein B0H66DRAFT_552113 [Apodospora peruviana]